MDAQAISARAAQVSAHAATLSAYAAYAAATAAILVAAIQAYVGNRQSQAALISARAALMNAESAGRHTTAAFRQEWINKVIDALCDYHSIVMTKASGSAAALADERKLEALRTKLEILLNPSETETVALIAELDKLVRNSAEGTGTPQDAEMIRVARELLKKEWVRIKDELK